jgi:hypothetical protein
MSSSRSSPFRARLVLVFCAKCIFHAIVSLHRFDSVRGGLWRNATFRFPHGSLRWSGMQGRRRCLREGNRCVGIVTQRFHWCTSVPLATSVTERLFIGRERTGRVCRDGGESVPAPPHRRPLGLRRGPPSSARTARVASRARARDRAGEGGPGTGRFGEQGAERRSPPQRVAPPRFTRLTGSSKQHGPPRDSR